MPPAVEVDSECAELGYPAAVGGNATEARGGITLKDLEQWRNEGTTNCQRR
jgi:hypothetical protein